MPRQYLIHKYFQPAMEGKMLEFNSNVKKLILKKGRFGKKPSLEWTCDISVRYEEQDTDENLTITIGHACSERERIIELCVESMHLEEESVFLINLEKENTTIKVNIILKMFTEKPYIFQWSEEEKLEASNYYKSWGTELFKQNKIKEAFYKFSTALKFTLLLDSVLETDDCPPEIINLRTALYNNLANCHLYFKNYLPVIKFCSESLMLSVTSKAFYRRALAYIELKEYEKAENDLTELLKAEPKNKAALEKYQLVKELDKPNRENYESVVKKMFQ